MTPHEELADHLDEEFASTSTAIRNAAAKTPAVDFLAHYNRGVFSFEVDHLDDEEDLRASAGLRDRIKLLGQQFSFMMQLLDRTLQEARTGGLIRVVLHSEEGGASCGCVVPDEHVFGLVFESLRRVAPEELITHAASVLATDRAVSDLATVLRARLRLPSANLGGRETESVARGGELKEPTGPPVTVRYDDADPVAERFARVAESALHPDNLQFVAYCAGGNAVTTTDYLADRHLAPRFEQISVAARREFYRRFSGDLGALALRFNQTARDALGGVLQRLVLDVEQGAIFYYRLGAGRYLVGVTIDQSRVSVADDVMAKLTKDMHVQVPRNIS